MKVIIEDCAFYRDQNGDYLCRTDDGWAVPVYEGVPSATFYDWLPDSVLVQLTPVAYENVPTEWLESFDRYLNFV